MDGRGGQTRLQALDGMRGIGAIGVVAVHVWMYVTGDIANPQSVWGAALKEMRLALMMFFVFSGFLLFAPWVRAALEPGRRGPDLRRYAMRRAARVAPLYYVALVGSIAVLIGTGHPTLPPPQEWPVFALFAQNYFASTTGQLNPPMWSLVVEVAFYAALPVLGWVGLRLGGARGLLAVCAGMVVAGTAFNAAIVIAGWPGYLQSWLPSLLPCFAAGMATAVLLHGRSIGPRAAGWLLAGGVVLVVADAIWHATGTGWLALRLFRDLPAAIGFGLIVAASTARSLPVLSRGPLYQAGIVSYGIYIWHYPVILFLLTRDLFPQHLVPALAAVLVPTVLLAAASWRLVERPCMEWGARWRPRQRRAPRERVGRQLGWAGYRS